MKNLKRGAFALCILIALLAFSGCENDKRDTLIDGNAWPSELCVRGVVYYTFGHGKAPAYKSDGSLYTCDGAETASGRAAARTKG